MYELHLGSVEPDHDRRLADLLGDPDPRLATGRFQVIARLDDRRTKVRSGALVRDLGHDQWSVYLLNEQQLQHVVRSDMTSIRHDFGLANHVLADVLLSGGIHAIAAAFPAMAPIAEFEPLSGVAHLAIEALGLVEDPESARIAKHLARDGVAPHQTALVHEAAKAAGRAASAASKRSAGVLESDREDRDDLSRSTWEIER